MSSRVISKYFCPTVIDNLIFHSYLRRKIQTEDMLGHHPTEDALAALELAQYFIKTGPRQVGNHIWKSTHTLTHTGMI